MSVTDMHRPASLVHRVQAILTRPKSEWDIIDTESSSTQSLFTGYVCILAAIPAICVFVGGQVFGYGAFFVHFHPPLMSSLISAVVGYFTSLVSVFLLGLIIDALAPSFDGEKNQAQAMKIAAYSGTAGWVAGVALIIPMLGFIAVLGAIYNLYLLYIGLPRLMKAPQDKAMGYTIITVVCAVVISILVAAVGGLVAGPAQLGAMMAGGDHATGTVSVNGQSVDIGKIQAAANAAAQSAKDMGSGQGDGKPVAAVDADKLKALLPDQVAGMSRTDISSQSAGAAGVATSNAEATYTKGDARVTLTVTDMTSMGAFAGLAGSMGVETSKETATGYEKAGKVDGRFTTEQWDRSSRSGKYAVLVANRFMIEADGSATSIDDLKAAVAAVGPDRLEAMAKS